ncbi:hypothetical protein [Micromonospora sp. DT233]
MVEAPDGQGTGSGRDDTTTTTETDPKKIGPGPTAPPADEPTK